MGRPPKIKFNAEFAGMTRCLGWCGKTFHSNDKRKQRYCSKCRSKKEDAQNRFSNISISTDQ
jgi:hypothetical protein